MWCHGEFPTPWGRYLHVGCVCGATTCCPARQRVVRCRGCGARASTTELEWAWAHREPPEDDGLGEPPPEEGWHWIVPDPDEAPDLFAVPPPCK